MTEASPSAGYRPRSRLAQSIAGLFIAIVGGWMSLAAAATYTVALWQGWLVR